MLMRTSKPSVYGGCAMLSSDLIRRSGRALYGEHWVTELADALHVNRKTVQRWHRGDTAPQPGVWTELAELIEYRRAELSAVRQALSSVTQSEEQ
jgi:hypothetical protein